MNPGALACAFYSDNGRFHRAFLVNPHATQLQKQCQRILGVDGAFLKHRKFDSVVFVLVTRNGEGMNAILAVAMAPSESEDNWWWFFRKCMEAGIQFEDYPVFSDRGPGLLATLDGLDGVCVRFCTRHIIGNIKQRYRISAEVEKQLWKLQDEETEAGFKSALYILRMMRADVADYVENIDPERWAQYTADSTVKLHGWRTTNFVESENAAAVPVWSMYPFQFFVHFMEKFMIAHASDVENATKWFESGRRITPFALKLTEEQEAETGRYVATMSSPGVFFVSHVKSPHLRRRVDLDEKTCTCAYLRQYGMPCRHILRALTIAGRYEELYDYFDECYIVREPSPDTRGIELVLSEQLRPEEGLLPPLQSTRQGRTRVNRLPGSGEDRVVRGPQRTCSRCRQPGHNSRTCEA